MRSLIVASALMAVSLATPALADDLLFPSRDATTLTALAAHQPYWALLAECAGVYGAANNFEAGRGDQAAAEIDAKTGARYLTDAIGQLQRDRGLSEADALAIAGDEVNVGRDQGREILANGSVRGDSRWNWKRSACDAVHESYRRNRRRS